MLRVCISGLGKTGKEIAKVILEQPGMKLVCAVCSPGSDKCGRDLGDVIGCAPVGVPVESADHLEQVIFQAKPEVVLDFSNPAATLSNARIFARMRVAMVIGTTGFSKLALKKLFILSQKYRVGIVYSPNITLGVNVMMLFANLAASILSSYDFQITEIHHKHKKDAPSGTALKIAAEIEKGLTAACPESTAREVPIQAVRAGGVVGKHQVMIIGENDQIEITHESFSRRAFALGAIHAAQFVAGRSGYFEMNDVLNLSKVLGDYLEREGNTFHRKYGNYLVKQVDPGELWA